MKRLIFLALSMALLAGAAPAFAARTLAASESCDGVFEIPLSPIFSAGLGVRLASAIDAKRAIGFIQNRRAELGFDPNRGADGRSLIDDLLRFEENYEGDNGHLVILTEGEHLVGSAGYTRVDATTCEVKKVYLDEKYKGRGIGAALVSAVIADARGRGFRRVILQTREEMIDAIRLYRKLGFTPHSGVSSANPSAIYLTLDLQ